jgi:hypothetical protein
MFATWGSESYTTCTEKVEVESKKDAWKTNGAWREDLLHLLK